MKVRGIVAAVRVKDLKPGDLESVPGAKTGKCAKCGEEVALAPSSQKVLEDGTAEGVICRPCADAEVMEGGAIPMLAPGAIEEFKARVEREITGNTEGEGIAGYPACRFIERESHTPGMRICEVLVQEGACGGFALFAGTLACDKPEHPLHFSLRIRDVVTSRELSVELSMPAWDRLAAWVEQGRGH